MQGDIRKKMQLLGRSGAGGWLATVLQPGSVAVLTYRYARWTMRVPGPLKST